MIQTSLTTFIIIYLCGALLILIGLAIGVAVLRRFRAVRLRRKVIICGICGYVREDESGQRIVRCEQCSSLNERGALRKI